MDFKIYGDEDIVITMTKYKIWKKKKVWSETKSLLP